MRLLLSGHGWITSVIFRCAFDHHPRRSSPYDNAKHHVNLDLIDITILQQLDSLTSITSNAWHLERDVNMRNTMTEHLKRIVLAMRKGIPKGSPFDHQCVDQQIALLLPLADRHTERMAL